MYFNVYPMYIGYFGKNADSAIVKK